MTVREIVKEFCAWGDRVEAIAAINDLVRAALRERDAAWRDAVLDNASARGDPLIRTIDYLRLKEPLRALLEDAGK